MATTFLTAEWRKLIMAQYAVEPAMLAPYLPAGTELDMFHGECYVSMVGFLFDRVRVKGLPIPFHTRFEEVNLRFYVRRVEADGAARRGVVFIREYVPKVAITLIANVIYEEPYATLPTRHLIRQSGDLLQVEYDWKHRGRWYSLGVQADAQAQPIAAGSVEGFITEHYWGFTKRTRGVTSQYEVKHPSWVTYPIRQYRFAVDFGRLYGPRFAGLNGREPDNILLAEGSAVSVDSGTRLN
jgi:uncharacterized protein YqjF (DUF2071 family)